MHHRRWASVPLIVFLVLASGSSSLGEGRHEPPPPTMQVQPLVVLRPGYGAAPLRIGTFYGHPDVGAASASFGVDWLEGQTNAWGLVCGSWPAEAKAAVRYALDIWETQIDSAVPMEVEACWAPLSGNVLGIGGPAAFVRDFGAGQPGTWYPVALANALLGADLNGSSGPTSHELNVVINSAFAGWYTGLDGNVPSNRHDLVTAILHEACHGLGFVSSMDGAGNVGTWGLGTPYPVVLDRYLQNGYGQPLLSFANGSAALRDQLLGQGGGVYLSGTQADAANGGAPVAMFAPPTWQPGSSISHLDTSYSDGLNALMTSTLWSGQAMHDPGPVTRAIIRDIGFWLPLPDLALTSRVSPTGQLAAGDAVTLTLTLGNVGIGLASGVTLTETLPNGLTYVGSQASPSLGGAGPASPSPGVRVWHLADLAAGEGGAITVWAEVDVSPGAGLPLWAVATVSAAEDEAELDNNVAGSLIGGYRAYLPLALTH